MAEQAIEGLDTAQVNAAPAEADLLTRALNNPIDIRPVLDDDEQRSLTRRFIPEDVPLHIATTLVLRAAGVQTSVADYDTAIGTRDEAGRLERKRKDARAKDRPSVEEVSVAADDAEASAGIASPYVEVLGQLSVYADRYRRDYENLPRSERGRLMDEIYDPTDGVDHPLLEDVDTYRAQRLGDYAVVAGRILRLLIIDRIINQQT